MGATYGGGGYGTDGGYGTAEALSPIASALGGGGSSLRLPPGFDGGPGYTFSSFAPDRAKKKEPLMNGYEKESALVAALAHDPAWGNL